MLSPRFVAALEPFFDELAELVAQKVVHRLQQGTPDMVDQSNSPLGRRRHCYAVRRRISEHKSGAAVVGRRHLLTQEALAEELVRLGPGKQSPIAPHQAPNPSKPRDIAEELRQELAALDRLRQSGMSDREATNTILGRRPRKPGKR